MFSQLVCSGMSQRYSAAVHVTIALNVVRQRLTAASDKHRMFAVLLWALRVHLTSAASRTFTAASSYRRRVVYPGPLWPSSFDAQAMGECLDMGAHTHV